MITEPKHSIIHQSYHSEERSDPLNGDGAGIAWYAPEFSARPALFKDVTPAWSNQNLIEIARVTGSSCILAHVRAASPNSSVQRLNCHPFAHKHLAFMHNGYLGGFLSYKRRLLQGLSDEAFHSILGSTDSEHAFAFLIDHYNQCVDLEPAQRLVESMQRTIVGLEALRAASGTVEPSACNFAVSDGNFIVASRYATPGLAPASLYFATGRLLHLKDGHYHIEEDGKHDLAVIASERLGPSVAWRQVEADHLLLAAYGNVELIPVRAA
jgi:predicted glutamine amidotransferase